MAFIDLEMLTVQKFWKVQNEAVDVELGSAVLSFSCTDISFLILSVNLISSKVMKLKPDSV